MRVIKRYANRRLYDTTISQYITLDEVKSLVLNRVKFKIVDNRTQEELTAYVLLQIITELEAECFPIFTTEMLENMICFYGNPLQQAMSQFLEQFFSQFADPEQSKHLFKKSPFEMMTDLTRQNMAFWKSAFSQPEASQQPKASTEKKET